MLAKAKLIHSMVPSTTCPYSLLTSWNCLRGMCRFHWVYWRQDLGVGCETCSATHHSVQWWRTWEGSSRGGWTLHWWGCPPAELCCSSQCTAWWLGQSQPLADPGLSNDERRHPSVLSKWSWIYSTWHTQSTIQTASVIIRGSLIPSLSVLLQLLCCLLHTTINKSPGLSHLLISINHVTDSLTWERERETSLVTDRSDNIPHTHIT